jgi:hypothetical protein
LIWIPGKQRISFYSDSREIRTHRLSISRIDYMRIMAVCNDDLTQNHRYPHRDITHKKDFVCSLIIERSFSNVSKQWFKVPCKSSLSSSDSDNTSSTSSTSRRKRRCARRRKVQREMEALRERQISVEIGYSLRYDAFDDDRSLSSLSGYSTDDSISDERVGFEFLVEIRTKRDEREVDVKGKPIYMTVTDFQN